MPRRKKSTVDRFTFSEPLSALFADQEIYDKLRADLFATTEKLEHQLIALRNSIPVASDSDARNVIHETVVIVEERIDSIRNNLDIVLNRHIKSYKKIRADKKLKKLENASKRAAKTSTEDTSA